MKSKLEELEGVENNESTVKVDLAQVLSKLGFLKQDHNKICQVICQLDSQSQKNAFQANLFTALAAIQSINIKDHYKVHETFELEDKIFQNIISNQHQVKTGDTPNNQKNLSNKTHFIKLQIKALMQLAMQPQCFRLNDSQIDKIHLTFMRFFLNRKESLSQQNIMKASAESPTPTFKKYYKYMSKTEKRTIERQETLNSQYEPPDLPDVQYMTVVDDEVND